MPLVGSYLAFFLFGGDFPGNGVIIPRFFILHVLILPLVIIALLGAHLGMLVRQKHTQFQGRGRHARTTSSARRCGRTFIAKTTGFLFLITGDHGPARRLRPDQPDLAVRASTCRTR